MSCDGLTPRTAGEKSWSSSGLVASDWSIFIAYGSTKFPNKSVDSIGSWVGILSIEHTNTPDPLKLLDIPEARTIKYNLSHSSVFYMHAIPFGVFV